MFKLKYVSLKILHDQELRICHLFLFWENLSKQYIIILFQMFQIFEEKCIKTDLTPSCTNKSEKGNKKMLLSRVTNFFLQKYFFYHIV